MYAYFFQGLVGRAGQISRAETGRVFFLAFKIQCIQDQIGGTGIEYKRTGLVADSCLYNNGIADELKWEIADGSFGFRSFGKGKRSHQACQHAKEGNP